MFVPTSGLRASWPTHRWSCRDWAGNWGRLARTLFLPTWPELPVQLLRAMGGALYGASRYLLEQAISSLSCQICMGCQALRYCTSEPFHAQSLELALL